MHFTLPNPALANKQKFSGIFDTIEKYLNIGLQGYSAYQQVTGAGSGSGQARGLAAITAKSNELLGILDQLITAAQQNPAQGGTILQQAQQLAAALSDPAAFYQAKSGQDAQVLRNAKTAAADKIRQIQAIIAGGGAQIITTNTSGQLVTAPASITAINSPIDTSKYLPYIAVAFAAFAILKK
jgi:hypothetical protein